MRGNALTSDARLIGGYFGTLLRVDLTSRRIWDETLDEGYARALVGGSGLAARYVLEEIGPATDPLGPDNPLVLMTGPLVGTAMPSAGRCTVCGLSPLTGIWGESNTGGFIGPELRFCGYDGLIVTGQAGSPVWLSVTPDGAQLHDASQVWGSNSYATQERVRASMGEARARVACIGEAGENRVPMAAVMNDHGRAAARTGMGAVMGSKLLKAIAFRGDRKVPVSRPAAFTEIVRQVRDRCEDDLSAIAIRLAGTAGSVDTMLMYGNLPIGYYQLGEWEPAADLSGIVMAERFHLRARSCFRCPISCGRETHAPRYGVARVDGPEYETLGALGSLLMISDLESVIYANHLCNVFGLDTISTGSTIGLACEMFERGVLNAGLTGGIEVRYGDATAVHGLIPMIARREGFGDCLAAGSAQLAARFGVPELAATVRGLEVPMHDPRAFGGVAVSYALSPRGACHLQGDLYGVDMGQASEPLLSIPPGDRFEYSAEKGRVAARSLAYSNAYNALVLCRFQTPGASLVSGALSAVTGWDYSPADLLAVGKDIVALKRHLNGLRGVTREGDCLPAILLEPLSEGGTEGHIPEVDVLLEGAYAELGWDPRTAMPGADALERLGIR
jgi:aldehyde:ferredoxin oxidoreductase